MQPPPFLRHWLTGIRFYIGVGIGLISLQVWWWGTSVYGGSNLATIRIQEAYAWLSVTFLASALLIGPAMKAFPTIPGKRLYWDARRLIGIGAFWFALLHASVAYLVQFQASNPFSLPTMYKQSLLLGLLGLVILLVMAGTSVNRIMKAWGIWWFRVHRLVYVAALASLLHAVMIGAHATSTTALVLLSLVALLWIGLQVYTLVRTPAERTKNRIITVCLGALLLAIVLNHGLTQRLGYNFFMGKNSSSQRAGQ